MMKKNFSAMLVCILVLTLCLSVAVSADKDESALAAKISLPAALLKGHTYSLNVPADENGALKLVLNGQSCEGPFVADGTQAVISYTDESGQTVAEYTLPVVDTADSINHLAYFAVVEGNVSAQENENDITASFSSDSKLAFVKELNAESFGLRLELPEESSNYEALVVTLTDAQDATVSISIRVDVANGTISHGEQSQQVQWGDSLNLGFKNRSRTVLEGDEELFVCDTDDRDNAFSGFSGGVYMTVAAEGVSGNSSLRLTRLVNQPLGHKNEGGKDITEPTVVMTTPLYTTQYMGETFDIPQIAVYDVLSPVKDYTVSVELPDGSTASEPFAISQYGRYKINFRVEDSHGNVAKLSKMVYVNDDVAPEFSVEALSKTSYKLGDAVSLPAYTVSDNQGVYFVDSILILPNAEIRLLTHDAGGEVTYSLTNTALYNPNFIVDEHSFKAEQTGEYTLRYVAYDDQYNRVVQELTFTVE